MIQQRPTTTELTRLGPIAAVALAAAMTVGFVAGQAAPDVFGTLFGTSAVSTGTTVLSQNADYGIRHLSVTQPLSEVDDYGIRHLNTTELTPADDYGIRHADR